MSNEQQPHVPPPSAGWGGEHDTEASGLLHLPPEGLMPPASDGRQPLAAPGQGYRPPEIGEAVGPPVTPPAATDPADTGQWMMPFASSSHEPAAPAAGGPASAPAADPEQPPGGPAAETTPSAAAMGQGAAAALAGYQEARAQRGSSAEVSEAHPADGAAPDGATAPASEPWRPAPEPHTTVSGGGMSDHPLTSYVLHVNGADRPVTGAWVGESLLHVLRERLGLAGAKDGCGQGECGACSVQVDGRLVAACLVPAATVAGSDITTVEGLGGPGQPSDVQRALAAIDVQCGFCLPGMAMTVHDLLQGNHSPTDLEARRALCGNLCRCSGYRGVLEAVRAVADERAARAAEPDPPGPPPAGRDGIPPQSRPTGASGPSGAAGLPGMGDDT